MRGVSRTSVGVFSSAVGTALVLLGGHAHAEIGIPAAPGGFYFSAQGAYQNSDTRGVSSGGATSFTPGTILGTSYSTSIAYSNPPPAGNIQANASNGTATSFANSEGGGFINAPDGWLGSVALGYVLQSPVFGIINRIEFEGQFARNREDQTAFGAFGMRSVDNTIALAIASIPLENINATNTYRDNSNEITLRLKSDMRTGNGGVYTLSFEPFYRFGRTDVTTSAFSSAALFSANRTSSVSSDMFGAMIALEGLKPLTDNLAFVARGAAGAYYVDADGAFADVLSGTSVIRAIADSRGFGGFRLGGEAGLKYQFTRSMAATAFGGVDWFSDVPVANLPRYETDAAAHIGKTDLTNIKAGVRFTFALSPPR